jgi:hypothetical protein
MTDEAQPGVSAPAAGGQVDGQPADAGGQPSGTPEQPTEVQVPLTALNAVRDELKTSKATIADLNQKFQQLQFQQQFQVHQPPHPSQVEKPPEGFKNLFPDHDEEELVSVADLNKLAQHIAQQRQDPQSQQAIDQLNFTIGKMQAQIQDPNYEQTIRTYLPEAINNNPFLANVIQSAPKANQIQMALAAAKMTSGYQAAQQQQHPNNGQPTQPQMDALAQLQQVIENASKPGNPGQMGGSGAMQGRDRWKSMSDADFNAEVEKVLGQSIA